eukprot:g24091.t1
MKLLTPEHVEELKRGYTGWRTVKPLFESPANCSKTVKRTIKRFFIVKADLLEVFDSKLLASSMCESMREVIIILIHKWKGNREENQNWRPISLLNVDYKILTKVITNQIRDNKVQSWMNTAGQAASEEQ